MTDGDEQVPISVMLDQTRFSCLWLVLYHCIITNTRINHKKNLDISEMDGHFIFTIWGPCHPFNCICSLATFGHPSGCFHFFSPFYVLPLKMPPVPAIFPFSKLRTTSFSQVDMDEPRGQPILRDGPFVEALGLCLVVHPKGISRLSSFPWQRAMVPWLFSFFFFSFCMKSAMGVLYLV